VENYERERSEHSSLLDQVHNEKQALSRAIHQNKELKNQLQELQDAFVNVTQENLNLTTRVQSQEFNLKQLEVVVEENRRLKAESTGVKVAKELTVGKEDGALKWDDESEEDDNNEAGERSMSTEEAELNRDV
jgi:hypothetical protein